MATREKIREGIDRIIVHWSPTASVSNAWQPLYKGATVVQDIVLFLHLHGVVIKVDCPACDGDGRVQKFLDRTFSNRCPKCNGNGYVATEPLIKINHKNH